MMRLRIAFYLSLLFALSPPLYTQQYATDAYTVALWHMNETSGLPVFCPVRRFFGGLAGSTVDSGETLQYIVGIHDDKRIIFKGVEQL
jgi:hypothetical protein